MPVLKSRLSGLFIFSVLLPLLVLLLVGIETHRRLLHDAQRDTEAVLEVVRQYTLKVFETQELALDSIEDLIRGMDNRAIAEPQISARLATIARRLEQTVSIWVSDADGNILAGSLPWQPGLNVAHMDYFIAQVRRDEPRFIGQPFVGRTTKVLSFAMSRRRPSASGDFAGTLHVAIDPRHLEESFARIQGSAGGAAALFRPDGAMLARHPGMQQGAKLGPDSPVMRALAANPGGETFQGRSTLDGMPRIYAYRPVEPFGVYVGYGVDLPDRISQWRKLMLGYGLMTAAVILLLGYATWRAGRARKAEARMLVSLQAEAELRLHAETELEKARSLESLGRMARGVAHDMNNLLTVVIGSLESLSDLATRPPWSTAVDRGLHAARAGGSLAASLLAYARTQVLQLATLDIASHLSAHRALLESIAGPRHELSMDIAPDVPPCRADSAQLVACIGNLVANARDAMPSGGTIRLDARERELTADDLHGNPVASPGRFIALAVSDRGIGMSRDVAAQAFEPFFTTKPEGSGAGLGLSQVFGLIRQHHGHVNIQTRLGEGSTVTLYLPATGAASQPALPAPAVPPSAAEVPLPAAEVPIPAPDTLPLPGPAGPAQPVRILVVDDQPDILELVQLLLTARGFEVVPVRGGQEALALLQRDQAFDLVLSDVVMPGDLDGIALLRKVKTSCPGMRGLLMSGYVPDAEGLAGLDVGFVNKPFTGKILAAAVDGALRG